LPEIEQLKEEGREMERTESIVVQVAPAYENAKIKEMEMFGWNLQGRQEIHEEGDAYGRPSWLDKTEYIIKIKVSHYVKLHFTRSFSLPNLDKIRQIESEYFNLPFPKPPSLIWPVILTVWPALTIPISIAMMIKKPGEGLVTLIIVIVWAILGYRWVRSRTKGRKEATTTCEQSFHRMEELRAQLNLFL
jgi:hypothetical protein